MSHFKLYLNTGQIRHILFPFDTKKDTAIDVAMEMVQELEISHLEPLEIAAMIDHEIAALVPTWNMDQGGKCQHQRQHSFNYEEDEDVNNHNPYFFSSSSPSSPHGSLPKSGSSSKTQFRANHATFTQEWPQGTSFFYFLFFQLITQVHIHYCFVSGKSKSS